MKKKKKKKNYEKSLNISLGKNSKDELIDGDYVYKLTANASPDIETIVKILLNDELETAFESFFFF